MSTQIVPFEFGGDQVRVVTIDGEPWFVARDVAAALGYTDLTNAVKQHCRGVAKHHPIIDSLGRTQQARVIAEADVLRMIVSSKLPAAEQFERWVFEEVLPEVRRTGSYGVQRALTPDEIVHQALQITAAKVQQLEAKVEADAPKVDYVETFVADEDLRIFRNVAKSLGMGEQQLRHDLIARKWIYEEKSSRWSEKEQKKVPHNRYSAYADKTRYFTPVPTHEAPRFRGEVMHTLKVTPAGAVAIARLYGKHLQAVEAVAS